MAGKRIDPSTIDEQAILEIVSSKNDRIGLSVGKCAATVGKEKPRPDFSKDSSQEKAIESSSYVSEKQLADYKNTFLQSYHFTDRKTLHIDRSLHRRICALVGITGGGATVAGFVNRILLNHFDKHSQEIGALLDQYYKSLKH